MFTHPRPNFIQSDAGFSVEVLGRTGIEYRELNKVVFVDSEVLAKHGIAVFKNSIVGWKPPFDTEPMTEQKREQIVANISEAIAFLNDTVIVQ